MEVYCLAPPLDKVSDKTVYTGGAWKGQDFAKNKKIIIISPKV